MREEELTSDDLGMGDMPMAKHGFESKELDIGSEARFRHDEAKELRQEINKLYQVLHQKGLSVGLPAIILGDINMTMTAIGKMNKVWASDDVRKKEKDEDESIMKIHNRGDETLAFYKTREQVLQLRESRIRMSTFLDVVIDKFELMSSRLRGKDMEMIEK